MGEQSIQPDMGGRHSAEITQEVPQSVYSTNEDNSGSETPDILLPQPTATRVFLAWEKLRVVYNAVLIVVVLGKIGWLALDFVPQLLEAAMIANLCFCAGPVAEGYIGLLTVRRVAVRYVIASLGMLVALYYTVNIVDRIVMQLPLFPGFPNGF